MTGSDPILQGYPEPSSVRAGRTVRLRIATTAARFHLTVHRLGRTVSRVAASGPYDGYPLPNGPLDAPWDWPAYELAVPVEWPSGVYLAALHPCAGGDHEGCIPASVEVDGRDARILFVVRPAVGAAPAPLLYKIPLFTYHAYNATGGGSIYVSPAVEPGTGRNRVTLLRPGGGTGGALSFPAAVDVYDPATPREGVAHWDLPFLAWLEEAGYRFDVCTDLDLHQDPEVLDGYRALVGAGHDEYWTAAMRDAVESFAVAGGNVAFFSGNTSFWEVEIDASGSVLSCAHPPQADGDCDQWWRSRPETALTGVSYRHGGGWWTGPRDPVGYTVGQAAHWVWHGTGVRDGDVVGAEARLVGYEADGLPLRERDGHVRPAPESSAPHGFAVLGHARLGPGWQDRPDADAARAVLGIHQPGGLVFTASTTDWPRVLAAGDRVVDRVTRNVLDRVGSLAVRVHVPPIATAGAPVPVWADLPANTEVRWAASSGTVRGDGVRAVWTPERNGPATVWLDAAGSPEPVFGMAATEVVTRRQSAQMTLLKAVRALVQATPPDPVPTLPAQDGNRLLTDPRWQPLTDGLRRSLHGDEVRDLARAAEAVLAGVQDLLSADDEEGVER